jgi:beta-N-acetylhexosaminidase
MAKLGDIYDKNPAQALAQAESCGYVLAAELLAIGVDFSFAPVLDLEMLTNTFHARIMHAFNQAAGQLHHHIRIGMEGSITNHRRCGISW